MKRYLSILLLLILFISGCSARERPSEMAPDADPANLPDLMGTYVVNGVDPLGVEYGGHLTITAGEDPGTYHLQWIIVSGIQEGIGVLKGNQLIVDWQIIESSKEHSQGTAIYTVTETGQLDGIRKAEGVDGEGNEQAYPNQ